ncbi:MAG: hypothetical protein IID61_17905 [SAR324 cluster bacterium]|nr:hypothetical protein [SAR324 cluster bacterium]
MWPDVISSVAAVVSAAALVFGAWVANRGVNAWRRETLGKREIEIAERAIHLFTKAEETIRIARNRYAIASEIKEVAFAINRAALHMVKDPLNVTAIQYYLPIHRLMKHGAVIVELNELRPLYTAYFGDEAGEWFDAIITARNNILAYGNVLVDMAQSGEIDRRPVETEIEYESVILDLHGDDPFSISVRKAVEQIIAQSKQILVEHVKKRGAGRPERWRRRRLKK